MRIKPTYAEFVGAALTAILVIIAWTILEPYIRPPGVGEAHKRITSAIGNLETANQQRHNQLLDELNKQSQLPQRKE